MVGVAGRAQVQHAKPDGSVGVSGYQLGVGLVDGVPDGGGGGRDCAAVDDSWRACGLGNGGDVVRQEQCVERGGRERRDHSRRERERDGSGLRCEQVRWDRGNDDMCRRNKRG